MTPESRELAPGEAERSYLQAELTRLRAEHPEMVYVSFPGDEKSSGGCVLYEKRELAESLLGASRG